MKYEVSCLKIPVYFSNKVYFYSHSSTVGCFLYDYTFQVVQSFFFYFFLDSDRSQKRLLLAGLGTGTLTKKMLYILNYKLTVVFLRFELHEMDFITAAAK